MPTTTNRLFELCLPLLLGGVAAQHNRLMLDADQCSWLFVAFVVFMLLRRCTALACFLLGFALFSTAGLGVVEARLDPMYSGDSMVADVRVVDFPQQQDDSLILVLEPIADDRLPSRFRVTWFEPEQRPNVGEQWQFELRLRQPRGVSNDGGFNVENWQFRERLLAAGHIVSGKRNRLLEDGSRGHLDSIRSRYVDLLLQNGGESAPQLAAVGIGSRHLISRQAWQRYALTGTSHLMAISGLHIGLAAAFITFLVAAILGTLRVTGNSLRLSIAAGAMIACLYAIISGFAVPSQRAVLMLVLVALAIIKRRRPDVGRVFVIVATTIFAIDPLSIMKPGFALSFAAVLALLWSANFSTARTASAGFMVRTAYGIRQLVRMQFTLLFGLLPLTIAIFDRVSLLAPLVNLLVVPIFSFAIVPLVLMSLLGSAATSSLSGALVQIAAKCVELVELTIAYFASLPLADTLLATAGMNPMLVVLPAFWVILPRGWPGRWLALVATLALFVYQPTSPRAGCVAVDVLDVGQGLAVVVESSERVLLYDTGAAFRSGGSVAESVILPFMRHRGIDRIDWLVVSHGDNDHAGGLPTLLRSLPVSQVFLGEPIEALNHPVNSCTAGFDWQADDIDYQFLHPLSEHFREGNDASCVLSIAVGKYRLLLTGDIEAVAEAALLDAGSNLASDIVVVPHHGSLTSSTPAFVNQVMPTLAIASAAYGNHWGLPKQRVVKRWQGAGATFLSTADAGAVGFELCAATGIGELILQREAQRRFWHQSLQ